MFVETELYEVAHSLGVICSATSRVEREQVASHRHGAPKRAPGLSVTGVYKHHP